MIVGVLTFLSDRKLVATYAISNGKNHSINKPRFQTIVTDTSMLKINNAIITNEYLKHYTYCLQLMLNEITKRSEDSYVLKREINNLLVEFNTRPSPNLVGDPAHKTLIVIKHQLEMKNLISMRKKKKQELESVLA